jgi:hypothetical protein
VENYEYELPSDFEDEEIDEDMAFTAEDKMRYAGWFGDDDADAAATPAGRGGRKERAEFADLESSEEGAEEEGSEHEVRRAARAAAVQRRRLLRGPWRRVALQCFAVASCRCICSPGTSKDVLFWRCAPLRIMSLPGPAACSEGSLLLVHASIETSLFLGSRCHAPQSDLDFEDGGDMLAALDGDAAATGGGGSSDELLGGSSGGEEEEEEEEGEEGGGEGEDDDAYRCARGNGWGHGAASCG